jgi:hypothetical protein
MVCERCGTVFCWDDADEGTLAGNKKRFCGEECKRRGRSKGDVTAQRQRKRQRRRPREKQLRNCMLRAKNPYLSRQEAVADATRILSESGVTLHPYECACGWWHLSSLEPAAAR